MYILDSLLYLYFIIASGCSGAIAPSTGKLGSSSGWTLARMLPAPWPLAPGFFRFPVFSRSSTRGQGLGVRGQGCFFRSRLPVSEFASLQFASLLLCFFPLTSPSVHSLAHSSPPTPLTAIQYSVSPRACGAVLFISRGTCCRYMRQQLF